MIKYTDDDFIGRCRRHLATEKYVDVQLEAGLHVSIIRREGGLLVSVQESNYCEYFVGIITPPMIHVLGPREKVIVSGFIGRICYAGV